MEKKAKLYCQVSLFFSYKNVGGEKMAALLMINTRYLVKSVFIVLVEWFSKLQCSVSNMTVLKYIFEMFLIL